MKAFNCIAFIFVIAYVQGVSVDRDLTLTSSEKLALDKFKSLVEPFLPHEYMKQEIYLVRWLRARDFNLVAAKTMLMKNLEWRKANSMDSILREGRRKFEDDYNHIIQGFDKQGRPIVETHVGTWDIRAAAVSGKQEELKRLMDKGLEQMTSIVRELQAQDKNVTQYYHIYNLDGFNLVQHACGPCIGSLLHLLTSYDNHYPGSAHRIVMLNTPAVFEPILRTLRLAASPRTREAFTVFGRNKKEWQKFLFNEIAVNQLTHPLGGSLVPNLE